MSLPNFMSTGRMGVEYFQYGQKWWTNQNDTSNPWSIALAWIKTNAWRHSVCIYHCLGLWCTGALQVVSGDGAAGLTWGVIGERCWITWLMEGTLQEVVQTAVSPVVWSGTNTKEIWMRKKNKTEDGKYISDTPKDSTVTQPEYYILHITFDQVNYNVCITFI